MKQEVYKITNNINGKVYIGITIQGVDVRWYKHCSDANLDSTFPIHNAIRKYGKDNFKIEVIEEIENEDFDFLKEREKYWIQYYDSYNREKGYNLTLGGDGTFGRFHSDETKEKIRQKALGRVVPPVVRMKMSESQKKVDRNYSDLAKKSNERWLDPKQRELASINSPNNKIILQFNLDFSEQLNVFRSATEAAKNLGNDQYRQNISKCANGILKTAYGYKWVYLEDLDITNEELNISNIVENFEKELKLTVKYEENEICNIKTT